MGRTLDDINQSKILYDPPPRVKEIKTKVNKWDLVKLKSFFTLLIVSFAVQKLLNLIKFHLFTFVFISVTLGGGS